MVAIGKRTLFGIELRRALTHFKINKSDGINLINNNLKKKIARNYRKKYINQSSARFNLVDKNIFHLY